MSLRYSYDEGDSNFEAAASFTTNLCDVTQAGCTNANPNFLDPANHDYHLTASSSAAINTGADLGSGFAFDFAGLPRPQGAGWDIGAYEYYFTNTGGVLLRRRAN